PADRPALVAPAPAAVTGTTSAQAPPDPPPPGVTPLRLHRPPDDTQPPAEPDDDLPRRVRQASLVPQLRGPRAEEQPRPHGPRDDGRTPELVRDRMTAYRAGWARGGGRQPGTAGTHPSSEGDPA
ncbi:MAG TPA: ATPase, partial [Streptomyces sp.]